ncbi:MAG: EAL domain-containing protein [Candidatus Lindowbacteria bacterium]|nr:EAL domain-containing protein [Candidatus Lindowbacteria bacterium]
MNEFIEEALQLNEHKIAEQMLSSTSAAGILWIASGDTLVNAVFSDIVSDSDIQDKAELLLDTLRTKYAMKDLPRDADVDLDEATDTNDSATSKWSKVVPIFDNENCLGGFCVMATEKEGASAGLLETAALTFAVSFKLRKQQLTIDSTAQRLSEISEIGPIFADVGDLDRTLIRLLELAVRITKAQVGAIIHYNRKGDSHFTGMPRDRLEAVKFNDGRSLLDLASEATEPDIYTEERVVEEIAKSDSVRVESLALFPMFYEGRRYGAMILINLPPGALDDEAYVATVGLISRLAAAGITSEERQKDAFFDVLTGLPNRRLLGDRLNQSVIRLKRNPDVHFAVVILGIDRFKSINDSLGHEVGDELLASLSERLATCVSPGDTFARLGGDQFTILLEEIESIDCAMGVANKIHDEVSAPFIIGEQELFISVSVGIVKGTSNYEKSDELLRDAEIAMNNAKSMGPGHNAIFEENMHERAVMFLKLEADLRKGIEEDQFVNFYQPIVDAESERIAGFETLIRWEHPERGLVFPDEFIPASEETGLIVEMGKGVLKSPCAQTKARGELGHKGIKVAVNLSARQIAKEDLPAVVQGIIDETGVKVEDLKLEVTESMAMTDLNASMKIFSELKDMGIQLSLDDFGTGHSSLSYLSQLPIDYLKIDRSFVMDLHENKGHVAIVKVIIAMAHGLGMKVIAEGAETRFHVDFLKENQCDQIQGYFFSKPVPPAAATKLLDEMNAA